MSKDPDSGPNWERKTPKCTYYERLMYPEMVSVIHRCFGLVSMSRDLPKASSETMSIVRYVSS